MTEPVEAVITDERGEGICSRCLQTVARFRLRVTAPPRCAGILMWATAVHTDAWGDDCHGTAPEGRS